MLPTSGGNVWVSELVTLQIHPHLTHFNPNRNAKNCRLAVFLIVGHLTEEQSRGPLTPFLPLTYLFFSFSISGPIRISDMENVPHDR